MDREKIRNLAGGVFTNIVSDLLKVCLPFIASFLIWIQCDARFNLLFVIPVGILIAAKIFLPPSSARGKHATWWDSLLILSGALAALGLMPKAYEYKGMALIRNDSLKTADSVRNARIGSLEHSRTFDSRKIDSLRSLVAELGGDEVLELKRISAQNGIDSSDSLRRQLDECIEYANEKRPSVDSNSIQTVLDSIEQKQRVKLDTCVNRNGRLAAIAQTLSDSIRAKRRFSDSLAKENTYLRFKILGEVPRQGLEKVRTLVLYDKKRVGDAQKIAASLQFRCKYLDLTLCNNCGFEDEIYYGNNANLIDANLVAGLISKMSIPGFETPLISKEMVNNRYDVQVRLMDKGR